MVSAPKHWDLEVDVVIVGSGIGGVTAALVAHDLGLRCVALEKSELLGGGSCMSGGRIWVASNHLQRKEGIVDTREDALTYLRSTSYGRHDEAKAAAFVEQGHVAVDYLEKQTPLRLERDPQWDDYYRHAKGSKPGRAIWPDIKQVEPVMAARDKTQPLLAKARPASAAPGWMQGHALVGPLISACIERQIPFLLESAGRQLIAEGGRVTGLRAEQAGKSVFIRANKAVLIASGGFEWNEEMNKQFMPAPGRVFPTTPPSNTGDGQLMGMELGAAVALMDTTVTMTTAVTLDGQRQAPTLCYNGAAGAIVVNRRGERCATETFYAAPGKAIQAGFPGRESNYINYPMYLIADANAANEKVRAQEHVLRGESLFELAKQLSMDPMVLEASVNRFNHFARQGVDPDFGRGMYDGVYGPLPQPDTSGPVEKPPFFAVRLGMATAGHRGGLVTDPQARVLNVRGQVIPGLYATSNAAAQLAVGAGYTTGQCNSQSLVFGYVAARHIAGK